MLYKGYTIIESAGGGKAGKDNNKTGNIQVRQYGVGDGYLLKKEVRYKIGDNTSKDKALEKAQQFVDGLATFSE